MTMENGIRVEEVGMKNEEKRVVGRMNQRRVAVVEVAVPTRQRGSHASIHAVSRVSPCVCLSSHHCLLAQPSVLVRCALNEEETVCVCVLMTTTRRRRPIVNAGTDRVHPIPLPRVHRALAITHAAVVVHVCTFPHSLYFVLHEYHVHSRVHLFRSAVAVAAAVVD